MKNDLPKDEDPNGLYRFHEEVETKAAALAEHHGQRLQCRIGCSACCVDDLTVFEIEAERIKRHCPDILLKETPHPPGACAFLDARGACRIYPHRPYVCRTQGLPLRWHEQDEEDDREWVEYRDICTLNEAGPPLETLPEEVCWTIGAPESTLAALQTRHGTGPMKRVALRALFAKKN